MSMIHPRRGDGLSRRAGRTTVRRWLPAALAVAVVLSACGGDDDQPDEAVDAASPVGAAATEASADQSDDDGTAADEQESGGTGSASGNQGGTGDIVYAWARPSDTEDFSRGFQPNRQCTSACVSMFGAVFDPLVTTDPETREVVGVLAESWEISDDGLEYTFHLKPEARFHDGTPVTAADVEFSLRRTVSEEYGEVNAYAASLLEGWDPDGTKVVDDHTIILRTEEPLPGFLGAALARTAYTGIVPRHAVEEMGDEAFGENPIGSGPYRFVEHVVGDHITIERNPDYTWGPSFTETAGGPPRINTITFVYVGDDQTRVAGLRSGEFDVIDAAPAEELVLLADDPAYVVGEAPYSGTPAYLHFNNSEGHITSELAVRQAISMAIDRGALNQAVFLGLGHPTRNFLTQGMPYLVEEHAAPDYDPAGAAALLDEAGWEVRDDGIRARDGQRLELDGVCYSDISGPMYEYLEAVLREVGIAMSVECSAPAAALERRLAGDFDLFTASIGFGNDAPSVLRTMFHCDEHPPSWNSTYYCNEEMDAALETATTTFDEDEAAAAYEEAQRIAARDVPAAPLLRLDRQWVARAGVEGISPDAAGAYRLLYDVHVTD